MEKLNNFIEKFKQWFESKTQEQRDNIGLGFWFVFAILFGLVAELFMLGVEAYEYYINRGNIYYKFEWDDAKKYTLVILIGAAMHMLFF